MSTFETDLSPPPTPGPSSFAPRPIQAAKPSRLPARSLSLRIPEDGQAFGGLTQPPLLSVHPSSSPMHTSAPPITLQGPSCQGGPSTLSLAPPPLSRLARKRPSRLNLAPPSIHDEPGLSSRSMPSSPVALSRSGSKAENLDNAEPPPSAISEAVKHLSSTLRGTPRRRPSMPFKKQVPDSTCPEPPSAASSHRPPEAYRDPSEHILSGKGSTLQHARSVYSQGPVEILPGLFLGDEHNARDEDMLAALGITTILNVAKETVLSFDVEPSQSSAHSGSSHAAWADASNRAANQASASESANGEHLHHSAGHAPGTAIHVPPTPSSYFTPPSTASLPRNTAQGDASSPRDAISPSVLRNTSSTPNLLTQFIKAEHSVVNEASLMQQAVPDSAASSDLRTLTAQDVLQYRSLRRSSGSSSDDAFGTGSSPTSSRAASTCTSAATELTPPVLMGLKPRTDLAGHDNSQQVSPSYCFGEAQRSPSSWVTQVELPHNATTARVAAGIENSRLREMRYIKLPWTHDETELASAHGGFAQGCALIAEALGIDARYWYAAKIAEDPTTCAALQDDSSLEHVQTNPNPGKILVHCQCGVSRSATLVIAFVMQAAAMRYGFEGARNLLGMHDCYNMVKEKSSSISPNISLIYQLVEWERYLSSAAGRLRDALGMVCCGEEYTSGGADQSGQNSMAGAGWSTEAMDEAMWSKMRLEEEEKEAAEEARRREERLTEAKRLAVERRAAQDRLEGRGAESAVCGEVCGSLMQRRRKKAAPALQLQTPGLGPPSKDTAAASMPSPGLNRRRPPALQLSSGLGAGALGSSRPQIETPFQTARMDVWTGLEHDRDGDVTMNDLEAPQTPLRTSAADSDVVSTPTARTSLAAFGNDSIESTLRTPNAHSSLHTSSGLSNDRMRPSSASRLPTSVDIHATGRGSADATVPTTLVSPSSPGLSPAMATSLSLGSRPNRFSLGAPPLSGGLTARLEADSEPASRTRARPDSMQSTMSSSSSSTALFGVTALSREERKKQHRRTFSSDWPTLQANLAGRRSSKVDGPTLSPLAAEAAVKSVSGPAYDRMVA